MKELSGGAFGGIQELTKTVTGTVQPGRNPLGFFAFVVLVVAVFLYYVVARREWSEDFVLRMLGGGAVFLVVIVLIVAYFTKTNAAAISYTAAEHLRAAELLHGTRANPLALPAAAAQPAIEGPPPPPGQLEAPPPIGQLGLQPPTPGPPSA